MVCFAYTAFILPSQKKKGTKQTKNVSLLFFFFSLSITYQGNTKTSVALSVPLSLSKYIHTMSTANTSEGEAPVVRVTPYLAAAIIEHAKRRGVAAGFLGGYSNKNGVVINDFLPMTHSGPLSQVSTQAYFDALQRRREAKKTLSHEFRVIGWYSAGSPPENYSKESFHKWCRLPGTRLSTTTAAFHVHAELPSSGAAALAITWSVERRLGDAYTPCPLLIDTEEHNVAVNAVLHHVVSQVLYGGASATPQAPLLNADRVAYAALHTGKDAGAGKAALNALQEQVQAALREARETLARGGGKDAKAAALCQHAETVRSIKSNSDDGAVREDFGTQKFKDALMIKCLSAIIVKDALLIQDLVRQYNSDTAQGHGGGGQQRGGGNRQRQQQQRGGGGGGPMGRTGNGNNNNNNNSNFRNAINRNNNNNNNTGNRLGNAFGNNNNNNNNYNRK